MSGRNPETGASARGNWARVLASRAPERPKPQEFVAALVDGFVELHGDRAFGDDAAVVGGVGRFCGIPVTAIGTCKGHDFKGNIRHNFGMPHPEGYRKALRLMKQAEKFGRPVLLFVDTPGAFAGMAAEERGMAHAIAQNLFEMSALRTPVVAVVTGEGGSGGGLALELGDRIFMLENAWFSVISPEGCASILMKDPAKAPEAADALKLDAATALGFGLVDGVVPEEDLLAAPERFFATLRETIRAELEVLRALSPDELVERRYRKYRSVGKFSEEAGRVL